MLRVTDTTTYMTQPVKKMDFLHIDASRHRQNHLHDTTSEEDGFFLHIDASRRGTSFV